MAGPAEPPDAGADSTVVRPASDLTTMQGGPAPSGRRALVDGDRLGPYIVRRQLGSGGMGDVYECEDATSGRRLAVKTLGKAGLSATARARFLREGRLAAALSHPNTVYVFGCDEVDGEPIIAMELVSGGTLADRVHLHGPMPVREAVIAVQQIIAGLAAAAERGILHRDVKPANCFIDADEVVKVGDFGLAVTTDRDVDPKLTIAQTMLGTPAFASPEQLRGDELDVRSDIYAVGATLYFLLCGRAPFTETSLLKLVSQVASDPPKPITDWRPDVPAGLAAILSTCLAKSPADRFPDYAALDRALAEFAGDREPARRVPRAVAFSLDYLVATLPELPFIYAGIPRGFELTLDATLMFVYFTLVEGRWGTTAGKAAFGLKVIDAKEGAPGWRRAAARAAILLAPAYAAVLVVLMLTNVAILGAVPALIFASALLAQMTADKRFGLVGWHDRLTNTRVVRVLPLRPASASPNVTAVVTSDAGRTIGPYRLTVSNGSVPPPFTAAFDPQLNRPVWIRAVAPGTPPLTPARRDLARPTRLRWLGGRRGPADGDNWDAFEAIDGLPLSYVLEKDRSWDTVRQWLDQMASELGAAIGDGTEMFTHLDDVWVARQGRIKVVDRWAAEPGDAARAADVMSDVVRAAAAAGPPPLYLHDLFLGQEGAIDPRAIAPALLAARQRMAVVSRARRARALVVAACLPVAMMLGFLVLSPIMAATVRAHPGIGSLALHMRIHDRLAALPHMQAEQHAIETVVAGRLRDTVLALPPQVVGIGLNARRRATAKRLVDQRPPPSADEVRQAEALIAPLIQNPDRVGVLPTPGIAHVLGAVSGVIWSATAVTGIAFALVLGTGVSLRVSDLAIVDAGGRRTRRWRAAARALIAWSPILVWAAFVIPRFRHTAPGPWTWYALAPFALVFLAGAIAAVRSPARGWQDRLAGTWIVPR